LNQQHNWYIDQENNLGLLKLKVCVDDEDFFTAEHQVYQSASILEKK